MNKTRQLHDLGQSLWLDNIGRTMLDYGSLARAIDAFTLTGLTSNPTIFEAAIGRTDAYNDGIRRKSIVGHTDEALFIELALEDLRRAADLFRPVFNATKGIDGWVSMEISPLLSDDTAGSIAAAATMRTQAGRPNLLVKIPGTPAGLPAIEESIFNGVPVNVTLLFSREHYLAAAQAYLRGIERRIEAGLDPKVGSVASLFVSRWDRAVDNAIRDHHESEATANAQSIYRVDRDAGIDPKIAAMLAMSDSRGFDTGDKPLPAELRNRLGIAIAQRCYCAYRGLLESPRWQRLAAAGALPQRLLWASTGTKDPNAPDTLYIEALAAPDTINTMPEETLHAFAEHGELPGAMAADGGDSERLLARFANAGVDIDALAGQLQHDGTQAFIQSWKRLLNHIADKRRTLVNTAWSPA